MSFLDRINECNRWAPGEFTPFVVGGEPLGMVRLGFADVLCGLGQAFERAFELEPNGLHWRGAPSGFEARTEAMSMLCDALIAEGRVSHRHGERYPVTAGRREDARFLIDRACAPYFGVRAFGQHINGFVRAGDRLRMWIARRSADRRVYPNRLDNMVAGGLPWDIGLRENLRKECAEEAGMPAELADRAISVGAITYCRASKRGLKPDVMYCYDLELPEDFQPHCQDGEVAGFELMPIEQVAELVRDTDAFKLNCNLVIIDFLVRHGALTPEHPDYLEIVQRLRSLA
jgi:isopentenyldiphosphate isomerase